MTSTCPAGHTSDSDDYCDVCGAPIGPDPAGPPGAGAPPDGAASADPQAGGAPSAGSAGATGSGSMLDLGPDLGRAGAPVGGQACPNCGAASAPGALFCEDCGYDFTTGQLPRADPPPLVPPPLVPPSGVAPTGTDQAAGVAPSGLTSPPLPPTAAGPPPLPPAAAGPSPLSPMEAAPPSLPADGGDPGIPGQQGPVDWVAEVWIDPDWHAAQEVTEPCPSPGMPEVMPLRGTSQLVGRTSVTRNIHPQIDCGADTGVSRRHAQLTTDGQRWWVEDLQSSNGTYVGTSAGPLPDVPVTPGQRAELPDDARVYVGAWTRIVVRAATADERDAAG